MLLSGIMAGSNRSGDLADPQVPSLKSMIIITIMIMKILGDADNDENYYNGSLMM